jgi:RNA polymerase sigma factor (sigma-70 family)
MTLTGLCRLVKNAEMPLRQIIRDARGVIDHQAEPQARLDTAVALLTNLSMTLRQLRSQLRAASRSRQEQGGLRRELVRRWYQWIDAWEALDLHPYVYEAIQRTLQAERQAQPDNVALRAAHTAWLRAQQRFERAKAHMLQANLRLVIHVANRYRDRGMPFLDLIQEGNLGLMRALEKFEPHRGLKFVTYAYWWIRQAISRALSEQHRTVRLPGHVVERQSKLRAAGDRLWDIYGRAPSVQELSTALAWTPEEVEELRFASQPIIRLDQRMTDEGDELIGIVADTQALQPEDLIVEDQLQHRLGEGLASLPAREALILRLRYGLETDHEHSLQEIGEILGISRERVRQLEKQALTRLRQPQWDSLLGDFAEKRLGGGIHNN